VLIQRFRQGIAESRPADVEGMTKRAQRIADAAGSRAFLVQDDQYRQKRRRKRWHGGHPLCTGKGQDEAGFLRPGQHRLYKLCGDQVSIAK